MRTKHLLYTMALAGIFAACTQEEFETVNGADALAGRKSIGKVTFTEAPSTRWDVDNFNTIRPEAGNGYSLLLVDVPRQGLDGQHVYPIDNYELVNDVQTNYVFKTSDGVNFSNDAELVEGNYLFVAPAQEGKLDRKTVEITLPTEQNLSLGADGKLDPLSAIKEFAESGYPFYIGHRFLSEGGSVSTPAMRNIFAFPEITVKNTDRLRQEDAILKQVILKQKNADKPFVINATINTVDAAKLLTNEWFAAQEPDTKDQMVVGGWAGHMGQYFGESNRTKQEWKVDGTPVEIPNTVDYEVTYLNNEDDEKYYAYDNGLYGATSDLTSTPKSTSQYIVINMPGDGIKLGYNESVTFNAIIPAEQYVMGDDELTIYAVLQNDEAYEKVMKSNTQVDMYPGKRYPNQDYAGLEVKGGKGLYFTIDINDAASDGLSEYDRVSAASILGGVETVKTTADLVAAIKANTSTENLNITVEGRNVVYNDEVNKAVANTSCQNVNIQGYIKIEGSDDAKNPLVIDPRVTIEQVVIEKGNVQAGDANLVNVFVAKGGALNLTDDNVASNGKTIINNAGTLTLSTTEFAEVNNYSVLKVNAQLNTLDAVANIKNLYAACGEGGEIISPSIDLMPSVEVMAGAAYAISGDLNYPIAVDAATKADYSDAGQLVLLGDAQIVKDIQWFNNKEVEKIGSILNNGKVSGTGMTLTVEAGQEMTVGNQKAEVGVELVIEGASHLLSELESSSVAPANYIAAAKVTNNGILNDVTVDGEIVMGAGSRINGTVSMTSGAEGKIDNTAKGVIVNDPATAGIEVFARFSSLNLATEDALNAGIKKFNEYTTSYKVTVARLEGALTVGDADVEFKKGTTTIDQIEFAAGSSLTIGDAELDTDFEIAVSAKDVEWNGNSANESTFVMNGRSGVKKLYLTTDDDDNYTAKKGNVKFNNCQVKSSLQ